VDLAVADSALHCRAALSLRGLRLHRRVLTPLFNPNVLSRLLVKMDVPEFLNASCLVLSLIALQFKESFQFLLENDLLPKVLQLPLSVPFTRILYFLVKWLPETGESL
jgi:hypothetical protein